MAGITMESDSRIKTSMSRFIGEALALTPRRGRYRAIDANEKENSMQAVRVGINGMRDTDRQQ